MNQTRAFEDLDMSHDGQEIHTTGVVYSSNKVGKSVLGHEMMVCKPNKSQVSVRLIAWRQSAVALKAMRDNAGAPIEVRGCACVFSTSAV
jgi:hypothetical protein